MYKIGDTVNFIPEALRYCKSHGFIKTKAVPGVVVWIHPQRRFMVLERRIAPGQYYRESILSDQEGAKPMRTIAIMNLKGGVGKQLRRSPWAQL